MQIHKLLHVFHLLVQRHAQLLEDFGHQARAGDLVPVEGPALPRHVAFANGLADVVQERRPAKPQIRLRARRCVAVRVVVVQAAFRDGFFFEANHVFHHLQRVGEILLMSLTVNRFHAFEAAQLRQELLQEAGLFHELERHGRMVCQEHFVELLHNAFLGKNLQAVGHGTHGLKAFRDDGKLALVGAQPRRKTNGPEHAERVVAVGLFGLQRSSDNARREVLDAPERVHQRTIILCLK